MTRIDPRILRTKMVLREAILALIQEKSYTSITIQDIADQAHVNRATFYLHYEGKEALLLDSLKAHFDALIEKIDKALEESGSPLYETTLPEEYAFAHVAENQGLYEILLSETGPGFVMQQMIDVMAHFGQGRVKAGLPKDAELPIPLELISYHVAGGLFGLLRWWLHKKMPYPPDVMARIAHSLTHQGVLWHFALSHPDAEDAFGKLAAFGPNPWGRLRPPTPPDKGFQTP